MRELGRIGEVHPLTFDLKAVARKEPLRSVLRWLTCHFRLDTKKKPFRSSRAKPTMARSRVAASAACSFSLFV